MNRRSKKINGYVNFPVNDPAFKNTGEGGMFVRLVVWYDQDWMTCCGGGNHVIYDECLVGTREDVDAQTIERDFEKELKLIDKQEERNFPHINEEPQEPFTHLERFISIDYLAALTIGSTGWSGFDEKIGRYWTCTYEDLTEDGKALYDAVQKLYDGCKLELLTWLDT